MVPQEKKASLVDLDQEPPSRREARPARAQKPEGTVSSSRRGFLKDAGGLGIARQSGAPALLTNSDDAQAKMEWAEWFQGNFRLMTDKEKAQARARLEERYSREYGKQVSSSRRGFLKDAGGLGIASLMGAAALLTNSDDAQAKMEWAEWFQGNFRLMTDKEKAQARARLEERYSREYGKQVTVDTTPAKAGVLFGY